MDKIKFVKSAVSTIVSVGTAKIVKTIIENNVECVKITDKVTVAAASFAIGGAVGELSASYTSRKIDEMVDLYVKHIKNRKTSD